MKRTPQRKVQLWMMLGYSMSFIALNFMDHGLWRHAVMGLAGCLLAVTVTLMVRSRWRNGCTRAGGEPLPPPSDGVTDVMRLR